MIPQNKSLKDQQTLSDDELMIDDLFMKGFEEEAAKLEITVDYYLAEFV